MSDTQPLEAVHPELMAQVREAELNFPDHVIALFDQAGRFRYVSVDPMPVRGWTRTDLCGRHYTEFIMKEDLPHLELAKVDTELNGESVEVGSWVRCKDGAITYLRVRSWRLEDPETGEEFHMTKSLVMDYLGHD